jgi:MFS family permease
VKRILLAVNLSRLQRYSPWRLEDISPLIRLLLAWCLLEGTRSGFYGGFLPNNIQGMGTSLFINGVALTTNLLADSLGRSFGGFLVQRFGLGIVSVIGAAVGLTALLLIPAAKSVPLLLLLSAVWGLSLSAIAPGLLTPSSRIAVVGREGRALTLTQIIVMPWIGLGTFGIGLLTDRNPAVALQVLTVAQAIALVLALTLIFRPERVSSPKQEYYPWNKLLIFLPAAFAQTFAPNMLGQLIWQFARELDLERSLLIALVVAGALPMMALIPFTGRYADKRNPVVLMLLGLSVMGLSLLSIAQKPSLGAMLVSAVVAGLGMGCFSPGWNAFVVRLLPEGNRAAMWGTILAVEGLGTTLGPSAGGLLAGTLSIASAFGIAGSILLTVALFYVFLLWKRRWNLLSG